MLGNLLNTFHKKPLFDAMYCLRAYPEFRESIITSITRNDWPKKARGIEKEVRVLYGRTQTLHEKLARAFAKRYPNTPCIDPAFDATFYATENNLSFDSFEAAYEHWLTTGKRQGLWYAPGKRTALTVVLKTYNEDFFIDEWLAYYEHIVGLENIIIFDHSSTTESTLRAYRTREKELLIIRVPRHIEHDTLHNTRRFHHIFDLIKAHTLFFTMLDTDEFLCRFDGLSITATGIVDRVYELKDELALGTVWLANYFDGSVAQKPSDAHTFGIKDQPLRHNIQTSKSIFRNDCIQEIIGHNRTVPGIAITPDLVLLHIKRANFEARIASQVRACVSFGYIAEHDNPHTIQTKLRAIESTARRHCVTEVLGYLDNSDAYIQKMTDFDSTYCVTTNVLASTLYDEPPAYTLTHPTHTNLDTLIRAHTETIPDRLAPGTHLATPSAASTSMQTPHLAP